MTEGKIKYKRENFENIKDIFEKKTGANVRSGRKYGRLRIVAATAAAAALCIAAAIPAMAAGDAGYDALYFISPKTAQYFRPVNMKSEDKGIVMEVEGAEIEGDTAEIVISLYDTEGDRIDETADLFDSYRINTPYGSTGGCSFIEYDEASGRARFLITIKQWDGEEIEGDKITFSVSRLLTNKNEFDGEIAGGLSNIEKCGDVRTVEDIRGGSSISGRYKETSNVSVLDASGDFSPVDGVEITGWGYYNGRVHIQEYFYDILNTDNHGYVYFRDREGNEIYASQSVSFWDESRNGSYEELVFDIGPEELEGLTLCGAFWTCDELIEGSWSVTFPVK